MNNLLLGLGITGVLVLPSVVFLLSILVIGLVALVLVGILIALLIPKLKRNLAGANENYRRLAEKLGMDATRQKHLSGVYRNCKIDILTSERQDRKLFCLMHVACNNPRGLAFRINPNGVSDNWAEFNDQALKAAVLTPERQRLFRERFASPHGSQLVLQGLTLTYNEGDWLVQADKLDRFNRMLEVACDVAELVERSPENPTARNYS